MYIALALKYIHVNNSTALHRKLHKPKSPQLSKTITDLWGRSQWNCRESSCHPTAMHCHPAPIYEEIDEASDPTLSIPHKYGGMVLHVQSDGDKLNLFWAEFKIQEEIEHCPVEPPHELHQAVGSPLPERNTIYTIVHHFRLRECRPNCELSRTKRKLVPAEFEFGTQDILQSLFYARRQQPVKERLKVKKRNMIPS